MSESLLEKFNLAADQFANHTIIIGCSGGVDSMTLLHLFSRANFNLHVVHVNYQKRGESSDLDEQLVEDFCQQHAIDYSAYKFNSEEYSAGNFQEQARNFRYAKMTEVAALYPLSKIALAHHSDDQVETFFMNLSRKSGILGLAAMPIEKDIFIRPLLHSTKEEITNYAVLNAVPWRLDASNNSNNYQRNRWRNEFIPLIKEAIPSIDDSVLLLVNLFQKKQLELEKDAEKTIQFIEQNSYLELDKLLKMDAALQFEIWRQLEQPAGSFDSFIQLVNLGNGKKIEIQGSYSEIIKDETRLQFIPLKAKEKTVLKLIITEIDSLPKNFSKEILYLNPEQIIGELKIRRWKDGDAIFPIGMQGKQLVSDIIKDAKIAQHRKKDVFIVEDDVNIHWVVKLKIGRIACATAENNAILAITCSNQ